MHVVHAFNACTYTAAVAWGEAARVTSFMQLGGDSALLQFWPDHLPPV